MKTKNLILLAAGVLLSGYAKASQPDILFILLDDLRWDAMSFKDHPYVKTPNIDKLREGGASLENAFLGPGTTYIDVISKTINANKIF